MSKLSALQSVQTLDDFASILDTSTKSLIKTLYKTPEASKYKTFDILKKNGKPRTIHAPVGKLKIYQRVLSDLLYDCAAELELATPRKPLSHGFRKDRSIITNASQHKKRRYVLNLDLEDFFPTFNFGRVRGFFIKDQGFALKPECATIIAQIACFQGALPQGSPCSPIIADLIAHVLDRRLVRFAKSHGVNYSRYADDLTFSTNEKTFPVALATGGDPAGTPWTLSKPLIDRITSTGFVINSAKTRVAVKASRQSVTGLTVNEKVNISQPYWRGVRSMCRALFQTGSYFKSGAMPGADPQLLTNTRALRGVLAHVQHVKSTSPIKPTLPTKTKFFGQRLHKDFHFFDKFVVLDRPLIITEGKTDPVYLRNAIRHLTAYQPGLGYMTPSDFRYRVAFYNYENTIAQNLGIEGGFGDLISFARGYSAQLKRYAFKPLAHPVIILIDNDEALTKFASTLSAVFHTTASLTTSQLFYRLTDNLYLLKTPEIGGSGKSCIEDLFDAKTRNIPFEGKVFHADEKTFDVSKHLSKVDFAKKVIAAHAGAISWTGFDPMLARIAAAIADYTPPASAKPAPPAPSGATTTPPQ